MLLKVLLSLLTWWGVCASFLEGQPSVLGGLRPSWKGNRPSWKGNRPSWKGTVAHGQ